MSLGRHALRYWAGLLLLWGSITGTALADDDPPGMVLAERYAHEEPVNYWVSEKLDGVRAYWDGRQLRFRSGRPIPAPEWFTAVLPEHPLDGELWLGRARFARLSGLVRQSQPADAAWREVRYMVFELPGAGGDFSARLVRLNAVVASIDKPWVQMVEQFQVADTRALKRRLAEVVEAGGEGLMLHRQDALYETGRSRVLLKLTPWLDAEARVIAHVPGKGKYAGMLGALRVEAADGRRFSLGSGLSDADRRNPPAIGTLVTYRYRELTAHGKPRFPRYLRVRELY